MNFKYVLEIIIIKIFQQIYIILTNANLETFFQL